MLAESVDIVNVRGNLTIEDLHLLEAAHFYEEDIRLELIAGVVFPKMSQSNLHVMALLRVMRTLNSLRRPELTAHYQVPIRLDENTLVEPDGILCTYDEATLWTTVGPANIELLVEVADSSLARDRRLKAAVYTRHGIAEYWIVNVIDRTLEVHQNPRLEGYESVLVLQETDTVAASFLVDHLTVNALLPADL
jgi:Uma2 family endonuclease